MLWDGLWVRKFAGKASKIDEVGATAAALFAKLSRCGLIVS